MSKKERIISGFVGINTRDIKNSFSKVRIKAKNSQSGFCGMNSGTISNSVSIPSYSVNKNIIGFSKNKKGITDCYYIKPDKIKEEAFIDKAFARTKREVIEKLDKRSEWNCKNDDILLRQKKFDIKKNPEEQTIEIHNPKELFDFATKVNEGIEEYVYANVELKADLDLKGKKWIPIGKDEMTPFRGIFQGNGFTIRNFIVNQKKVETAGFIGYLKDGIVENLSLDCVIHGGKYVGGFVGINDGGTLLGCHISMKGDAKYCLGAFVGKNNGQIEHCSCSGIVQSSSKAKVIASASTIGVMIAAMLAIVIFKQNGESGRIKYPAIPVSQDAIPIEGDEDKPITGGNSVEYKMETKLVCKKGKNQVNINFKNPGKSNHNIVVSLQITDEELLNVCGNTGRSQEEQDKLEQDETYDTKTNRVTIAESGSIPPGYEIATLDLDPLENGKKLPKGTYNAIIFLSLYDIHNNAKAMINSQTPVKLTVEG